MLFLSGRQAIFRTIDQLRQKIVLLFSRINDTPMSNIPRAPKPPSIVAFNGGYTDICCGIFTLSKYLGIFPFSVSMNGFRRFIFLLPLTVILTCISIYASTYYWAEHSEFNVTNQSIASKVLVISYLGFALIPTISNVWLMYKIKTFAKIIKALIKIRNVTRYFPKKRNLLVPLVYILSDILLAVYDYWLVGGFSRSGLMYATHVFFALSVLVSHQFVLLVEQLRSEYAFLLATVGADNAEPWTKCHELLASSSSALAECYSPQLLLYFLSIFVMTVSNAYSAVLHIKNGQPYLYLLFYLGSTFLLSFSIWYILFNCRDALVKVRC